jgi:N-acetyl-gamma-glutamylphosphate reductase
MRKPTASSRSFTSCPPGQVATLAHAVHTNSCAVALTFVPGTEAQTLIVTAAIDNLIKGASGQAVQNMNIMCWAATKRWGSSDG